MTSASSARSMIRFVTAASTLGLLMASGTSMAAQATSKAGHHRAAQVSPSAQADAMIYSGGYDLTYTVVSGSIEVCTAIRMYSYCAPVALTIPMDGGMVTTETLIVAFEDYKAAIHALRLPESVLTAIDTAVEGTLLPALADELNANFVALPVEMSMQQSRPVPTTFSAMFVGGDGVVYYGVGELALDTGVFTMIPDFVTGQIDPTTLSGKGSANVPVTVEESVDITAPWGVETLTVSARGNLGAGYDMARQ